MEIILNGKTYKVDKISRAKYSLFNNAFKKIEEKQIYDDEDLDLMAETIVKIYDNQFTVDDINEQLDVPDLIWAFSYINISIMEKINKKAKQVKRGFIKDEK